MTNLTAAQQNNMEISYTKLQLNPSSHTGSNPLTPELNPSEQRCLSEFLLGISNFKSLLKKKKSISRRLFLQI
jgi:hypothetical protein